MGMIRKNIVLATILAVAVFLRFFLLGTVPVGLYVDEAAIGVDAVSVAQTGRDMHGNTMWSAIYPSYGDYKLPMYILFAAASVKLFGASEFSVRLPSALAGIATVLLCYFLALELFRKAKRSKEIALFVAGVAAILPWDVLFSRTGFEGHLGQAFVLGSLLIALLVRKKPWFALLSAVVGAVAVYTYYSARFVFPVVYAGAFILQWDKKVWKRSLLWFLGGVAVFLLLLLPMVRSPLYLRSQAFRLSARSILQNQDQHVLYSNMLREADGNSVFSRIAHHRHFYFLKDLARNYAAFFDAQYLFLTGDPNLRHGTGKTGIMLLTFAPLLPAGIYALVKRHKKLGVFLLLWWIVALLPAAVPLELPHALRSLNGLGIIPLVCGLGAYELFYWIRRKRYGNLVLGVYAALVITNVVLVARDYTLHYPLQSASAWFDGNKQVAELVREKKSMYDHVVVAGDEKMFLWVLFYGGYTGRQMQGMPSARYWKTEVENISFGTEALRSASGLSGRTLVIGLPDELAEVVGTTPIHGTFGQPIYAYGVLEGE